MPKAKAIYSDRDYLEARFSTTDEKLDKIIAGMEKQALRIDVLEEHKTETESFVKGAKWVIAGLVGLVGVGLVKIGLGDGVANAAQHIGPK